MHGAGEKEELTHKNRQWSRQRDNYQRMWREEGSHKMLLNEEEISKWKGEYARAVKYEKYDEETRKKEPKLKQL